MLAGICLLAVSCRQPRVAVPPAVEFTRLPPAGPGSADVVFGIEGRVKGARPGQKIVLFARSGVWWVQPFADRPFTAIQDDSAWKSSTHPGTAYAALLVDPEYYPPSTANILPEKGGPVHAVAIAEGPTLDQGKQHKLNFSGYEWIVRQAPGSPAGTPNRYDPGNAWVDPAGSLHLRIAKSPAGWTSAEVALARSLGYGSYRLVVSDVSQLERSAVLTISTWDGSGPNREMDIEISRWGEAGGKNAQYVVQPYYVAANVVQFLAPAGRLLWWFDWEPGRVKFRTLRETNGRPGETIAQHVFSSGVPAPGAETVHIQLYVFDNRRWQMEHGGEVVIEKFEYLP